MRRRSFRPALESLDFRITPSDVVATGNTVGYTQTSIVSPDGGDSTDDPGNVYTDPSNGYPFPPNDGDLWCPEVGS